MPTYTQTQTVFALSMLSNVGWNKQGTLDVIEEETANAINKILNERETRDEIGSWNVIWGPAIYQAPLSDRADNVMVVFQAGDDCTTPGQLVIGIAATNVDSAFDWLVEDFLVMATHPWDYGNPGSLNPNISLGTYYGLSILQHLIPGLNLPGVYFTLKNFLASVLAAKTSITVTGHSLGGALSPAVALWLSDTKGEWDPGKYSSLACLPSAGPTSGDQDFSTYYGDQLGSVTTRVHNRLDLVPHAWERDDLLELPELYNPPIPATLELDGLLAGALAISWTGNYTQICPSAPALPGQFNFSKEYYDSTKSDCDNYIKQVIYQHVQAYFDLLEVTNPTLQSAFAGAAEQQYARLQKAIPRKLLLRKRSSALHA